MEWWDGFSDFTGVDATLHDLSVEIVLLAPIYCFAPIKARGCKSVYNLESHHHHLWFFTECTTTCRFVSHIGSHENATNNPKKPLIYPANTLVSLTYYCAGQCGVRQDSRTVNMCYGNMNTFFWTYFPSHCFFSNLFNSSSFILPSISCSSLILYFIVRCPIPCTAVTCRPFFLLVFSNLAVYFPSNPQPISIQ